MPFCTTRDIPVNLWGTAVILPKGTRVRLQRYGDADSRQGWVVAPIRPLIELTGNMHDPVYRYVWINAEDVATEET